MKVVSLVSSVKRDIEEMLEGMHLETDAVIVNQLGTDTADDAKAGGTVKNEIRYITAGCGEVTVITQYAKGVGLSRNTCIEHVPDCDICLFTDEDIVYDNGYSKRITDEYTAHPDADALLFNIRVCEKRRTYWNKNFKRIRFYNYGRYPAYSISIKKDVLLSSGVYFPIEFGGGAKYSNGEDSVFLHDLLKAGVKIYRSPVCLGEETERESSWFDGYNDRFFIGRGALYVRLYGAWARIRALLFLIRHRYMYEEIGFGRAYGLMKKGMREFDPLS